MRKTNETLPNIFVKKLGKDMGKILSRKELLRIWVLVGGSKSRLAYALTQAKSIGIVRSLGGDLYLIQRDDHMEMPYWLLVDAIIRYHLSGEGIIAHEKSMELHLHNFEFPETLIIYTRDISKRIQIGEYRFHLRALKSGKKTGSKDMFRIFLKESSIGKVDSLQFRFLSLEASLLDVASLRIHDFGIKEELLFRFLKRYESRLSREILGRLVEYRYIRAINRVRAFSKTHGFQDLYEKTLDIIKYEGSGCYVSF